MLLKLTPALSGLIPARVPHGDALDIELALDDADDWHGWRLELHDRGPAGFAGSGSLAAVSALLAASGKVTFQLTSAHLLRCLDGRSSRRVLAVITANKPSEPKVCCFFSGHLDLSHSLDPAAALVISLARTPERTARARENLAALPLPLRVVQAVDGADPATAAWLPRAANPPQPMTDCEVALVMSWWRACSIIVNEGWPSALVLEDDAVPIRPGEELLNALAALPAHDVALLHDQEWPELVTAPRSSGEHTDDFLRVAHCSFGTCALHVTQAGARQMLHALAVVSMPIDVWIRENTAGLAVYQAKPGRAFFRHDGWAHTTVRDVPCPPIPKNLHRILDGAETTDQREAWQEWRAQHPGWHMQTHQLATLMDLARFLEAPAMRAAATPQARREAAALLLLDAEGGVLVDPGLRCERSLAPVFGCTSIFLGPPGLRLALAGAAPGHPVVQALLAQGLEAGVSGQFDDWTRHVDLDGSRIGTVFGDERRMLLDDGLVTEIRQPGAWAWLEEPTFAVDPDSPIAIAITTRNRPDLARSTFDAIRRVTPGAPVFVVDDASDEPVPFADFRFKRNVGVAMAKNKCLELLMDRTKAEHFFLFDDDTFPLCENWWQPYVESESPHLLYLRPEARTGYEFFHQGLGAPNGCMLYATRAVVEAVGGMDKVFGRFGWEHVHWSDRIYNYGFTKERYGYVEQQHRLIRNLKSDVEVPSTLHGVRGATEYHVTRGLELLKQGHYADIGFVEYRDRARENVILTCFYDALPDPARKEEPKPGQMQPLLESLHGETVHIFSTNPTLPGGILSRQTMSPYFQRWHDYLAWLNQHPEVEKVWMVDAFDGLKLRDCWDLAPGILHVGSEARRTGFRWMVKNHPESVDWIRLNARQQLLNPGLVGGDRETVLKFLRLMTEAHQQARKDHADETLWSDMGLFNEVVREYCDFTTGPLIHTEFKAFSTTHPSALWAHK